MRDPGFRSSSKGVADELTSACRRKGDSARSASATSFPETHQDVSFGSVPALSQGARIRTADKGLFGAGKRRSPVFGFRARSTSRHPHVFIESDLRDDAILDQASSAVPNRPRCAEEDSQGMMQR